MFCRNHRKWVLIGVRCETLSASLQVALSFQATRANGTFWMPCLIAAHDRLQACLICLYDLLLIYFRQKKRDSTICFSVYVCQISSVQVTKKNHSLDTPPGNQWRRSECVAPVFVCIYPSGSSQKNSSSCGDSTWNGRHNRAERIWPTYS